MHEIYTTVNDTLMSFIGSTLDTAIPDSIGLFGILFGPVFSFFYGNMYSKMRDEAEAKWDQVFQIIASKEPTLARLMHNGFENPEEMVYVVDHLFGKLSQKSMGLTDHLLDLVPDAGYDKMGMIVEMSANAINKGVSMMFLFINVFAVFSEINLGDQSKYTSLDVKGILAECPAYLKAMEDLAKKGKKLAIKAKADPKQLRKDVKRKAITSGTAYAKRETKMIEARADELAVTAGERKAKYEAERQIALKDN